MARILLLICDINSSICCVNPGLAGVVAQSVMSATDTLGHQDVHGLFALDPCLRQWISVCTMPKDVDLLYYNWCW